MLMSKCNKYANAIANHFQDNAVLFHLVKNRHIKRLLPRIEPQLQFFK